METPRLLIVDRCLRDIPIEEYYNNAHPEINELDPPVGACNNPFYYSVFLKNEESGFNCHIGICSLYNLSKSSVEFGVRIFIPEYWNKGYGSETVNALCELVFSSFPGVDMIFAKTPTYNTRAIRCYEKCGFIQDNLVVLDGHDMVYMVKRRGKTGDNTNIQQATL